MTEPMDELELANAEYEAAQEALVRYLEENPPERDTGPLPIEGQRLLERLRRAERRFQRAEARNKQALREVPPLPAPDNIRNLWMVVWIGCLLILLVLGLRWIF